MPRIHVPEGDSSITQRVWELRPLLGEAADRMTNAVFHDSELPPRLREVMRLRIAQINGCRLCLAFRDADAVVDGMTEEKLASVGTSTMVGVLDERERLAVDFAERFATDHQSLDGEYFEMLRGSFDDGEILDLTFCVGRFLAFGRLVSVLGLDDGCDLHGTSCEER